MGSIDAIERVGRRRLGQRPREPGPGAGEADLERAYRAAGHRGRITVGQGIPRHEQDGLALQLAELADRAEQGGPFDDRLVGAAYRTGQSQQVRDRVGEPVLSQFVPAPVGDRVARDDEEPGQSVVRNLGPPPLGDQEGVGYDVLRTGRVALPPGVGEDPWGQLAEHRCEPVAVLIGCSHSQ